MAAMMVSLRVNVIFGSPAARGELITLFTPLQHPHPVPRPPILYNTLQHSFSTFSYSLQLYSSTQYKVQPLRSRLYTIPQSFV